MFSLLINIKMPSNVDFLTDIIWKMTTFESFKARKFFIIYIKYEQLNSMLS